MSLSADTVQSMRRLIDDGLREVYPVGPDLMRQPVQFVLEGKGKRLRPILTLITAKTCGGEVEEALSPALAVELLHNFTLVHDDVMDQDDLRHGKPTVHSKWDEAVAILAGDALFILAIKILNRSTQNREALNNAFMDGALAVCEGQAMDKTFETQADVSVDDYIRMIDLKTGFLLGLSAELGALSANANENQINGVRTFGRLLGRAFQIQDDLLEMFSDTSVMGKSLGSDLLAEKKTYLFLKAQEEAPDELAAIVNSASEDLDDGMTRMRALLSESGIQAEAEQLVKDTVAQALGALEVLSQTSTPLHGFAELVLNRQK